MHPYTRVQYDTSDEIVRAVRYNNLRKKGDLTFFERGLMEKDIIPQSYFEKRARREDVLVAFADLVAQGVIDPLRDGDLVLWVVLGVSRPKPKKTTKTIHPRDYKPGASRKPHSMTLLRADRNLFYYAGQGSIPNGIQNVAQFTRRNLKLFQKQYPELEIGPEAL